MSQTCQDVQLNVPERTVHYGLQKRKLLILASISTNFVVIQVYVLNNKDHYDQSTPLKQIIACRVHYSCIQYKTTN